ncbi:MAG: DUF1566 domain-containing protein [Proteobacteria bacterium]|nr:DUF1566 domain-containing protein [Pseudomonadota bacterium]
MNRYQAAFLAAFFWLTVLPVTAGTLSDNGDGTVSDDVTELIWQQGEGGRMNWEAALSYCAGLSLAGRTDWRLPNIKELKSLVDFDGKEPAADSSVFQQIHSSPYWSSTTFVDHVEEAWHVSFRHGYTNMAHKSTEDYVRCVHGDWTSH